MKGLRGLRLFQGIVYVCMTVSVLEWRLRASRSWNGDQPWAKAKFKARSEASVKQGNNMISYNLI